MSVKSLPISEWGTTVVLESIARWWKPLHFSIMKVINSVSVATFGACIQITNGTVSAIRTPWHIKKIAMKFMTKLIPIKNVLILKHSLTVFNSESLNRKLTPEYVPLN